jgi:alkanesulfonate monooxygenase SsuD/methylene tetrahydromethanopterin reductase-like flavin-dependent oxidoreductase (luciferase family)
MFFAKLRSGSLDAHRIDNARCLRAELRVVAQEASASETVQRDVVRRSAWWRVSHGQLRGLARAVERLPVQELTVHDVVWWRPVWPILTLVAANTERVRLGPDVTHPYLRHPVETEHRGDR